MPPMTVDGESLLFAHPLPRPRAAFQLVCLPSAGSGANMYRRWPRLAGDDLDIVAVRPPGRERRVDESPIQTLRGLAEIVADELPSIVDRPYGLFGHSMGALVAYEVAALLAERTQVMPRIVALSAAEPRLQVIAARSRWDGATPDELRQHLRELGGTPEELLSSEEMMALIRPAVLNDLIATDEYATRESEPLPVTALVVAGASDPSVTELGLHEWDRFFAWRMQHARRPGGHFYFSTDKDAQALLEIIVSLLNQSRADRNTNL
ncbi:thioesterase II family protein [Gryllotalpicola reticulitermitis]|uniref:Thioesterase II family protein n=1 Tax=Gryllotalpicola reticulitermitis TaxID=1184153 RepID=A0ABV8Q963_9MICO